MQAGKVGRSEANRRLMRVYAVASLALIGLYPFLPGAWRGIAALVVYVGAAACLSYGRRAVMAGRRLTWTLLFWALVVFAVSSVVLLMGDGPEEPVGRLLDAVGYLLLLAAALALIIQRGTGDLGGVIDAAVIAFAAGSILWVMLPHRQGADGSVAAQVDLFAVVFALTGVLGALIRLAMIAVVPRRALWWLLGALGLLIGGNVVLSLAGSARALNDWSTMMLMAASTALGLFGLEVTAPGLVQTEAAASEQLSTARLVFLGFAVAVIPVVIGVRELGLGDQLGLLLALQGTIVGVLVMARIGVLSAQRARAERTLEHQATHDPLTHLPNRRQFMAQLGDELGRGIPCALLFCDLDGFKPVNDRFGHDVGDSVLIDVGSRLLACVKSPHVVSRFGGDEFAALLIDTNLDEVRTVQACIETALRSRFEQVDGATLGVSVGVAFADDVRDPEQLIRAADQAMYREKSGHGDRRPDAR